jgi:hypothetical protein
VSWGNASLRTRKMLRNKTKDPVVAVGKAKGPGITNINKVMVREAKGEILKV